ncbi:MAG TPA: cupin domain-containing protein [Ideonella sp.]|nr:cupin domain-containing protein [Ideonella sp.]
MKTEVATPLLGGLSPACFMRRHWQRRPLLVRQALPGVQPPLDRAALFALAGRDDVESRLVLREGRRWRLRHGPFARRALPSPARPGWTLLVQGLDLHVEAAHALLGRFRFVPDARLDDLMVSYASDGGGVGPHLDSYDVFLLQVHGRRRWRVGRARDTTLRVDAPLKLLRRFEPEHEWLLEPGDLLYLPPNWAHDGVAEGECMTCSVGFRAPRRARLGREVLQALIDAVEDEGRDPLYADAGAPACARAARIPQRLQDFAREAVQSLLDAPRALECALGEVLSEPKPGVVFERNARARLGARGLRLDRRSRMLYDDRHVYLNGEAFRAGGRDARALRRLADDRRLPARDTLASSDEARALLAQWLQACWVHAERAGEGE